MIKLHKNSECSCHIESCCNYKNEHHDGCGCHTHGQINIKNEIILILVSAFLIAFTHIATLGESIKTILFLIVYVITGYGVLKNALKGIYSKNPFDENFLMTVATIGALVLGEYVEAVLVMLLYRVGMLFENYAVGRSRKNIEKLMDIRPDYANVEMDGKLVKVNPSDVETGSIIVVKPGEKVAIDGVVVEGASAIDTSSLTGESVPLDVGTGDDILSGVVNLTGVLKIKTTKAFGESTVSKILDLVENASAKKSKSEHFIKKFSLVYTPIVCLGAFALAIIPPVIRLIIGANAQWGEWVYRALTFLVISCPCALVISIPLTFFAGIGGASKKGILIKGSNFIETLSKLSCVMFDKTGTLTKGEFKVKGVYYNKMNYDAVLYYAALAESYIDHPISRSIKNVFSGNIDTGKVTDIKEIAGHGVTCRVGEKEVAVGNHKLMKILGISYRECPKAGTSVHVAIDGKYEGCILVCDTIKGDAKKSVSLLKKMGIKDTVMLTGDNMETADAVASEVGIDKVYASLLPDDKVRAVEVYLKNMNKNQKLAFVGDGINDAPVLARADVGIAMGEQGLDAAIEVSDVVIMDDNISKIADAINISKKCMRVVYQNIVFSIGIKSICLVLGAFGIASMLLGVFADVGVMVIAVLNAVRCLKWRG